MSRQSPCIARALPCPYDLNTPAGADFFVAAGASFCIHDRPFACFRAREDRHFKMSNCGSITLAELEGKLDLLEIKCRRCERHGRVSLARLIEEHGADKGLPDLWTSLAGDCQHARSTALNNRCAIYYPQLPMLFLPRKEP